MLPSITSKLITSTNLLKLVHSADEIINVLLAVAVVTALNKVVGLLAEPAPGVAKLERPEEVVDLLEVWPDGEHLVYDVFHTDHALLPETLFHDGVV